LFIESPTRDQLQFQANENGLTAEHISFEVLRLYPPTRHVARLHKDTSGKLTNLTADIEGLHHTASVWNNDPMSFKPERWQALEGMDTKGYMPFGEAPFRCLARHHKEDRVAIPFDVTMIAVLAGCFIEAMADKWYLDEQYVPPVTEPLKNGREDYNKVSLHRPKPGAAGLASNTIDEPDTVAANTGSDNTGEKATVDEETKADDEPKIKLNEANVSDGEPAK